MDDKKEPNDASYIAFEGSRRVARGQPKDVALAVKEYSSGKAPSTILVFDATSSRPIELDLRGSLDDVARRYDGQESAAGSGAGRPKPTEASPAGGTRRGPGRPKLGVVGKEVTLLPRHWKWLNGQPGGASVTLRKLVEKARREGAAGEKRRRAQESAYRFMTAMAGNLPGFEEATRALFADDAGRFADQVEGWPGDLREHATRLAQTAFDAASSMTGSKTK